MAKSYQISPDARAKAQEIQEHLDELSEAFHIPGSITDINTQFNQSNSQALVYHLCENWSNDSGTPAEDELTEGDLEGIGFTDDQIQILMDEGYIEPIMDKYEELIENIRDHHHGSIFNFIDKNGIQDIIDIVEDKDMAYLKTEHSDHWETFNSIHKCQWLFGTLGNFSL